MIASLAVHRWPGPTPAPVGGLIALLLAIPPAGPGPATVPASASPAGAPPQPHAADRETARRMVRLAAREALAALLGRPVGDITIATSPGAPPQILLAGQASAIGISFSHDNGQSLIAINLQGPIGADLMRIQDIADWQAVARDYLGPAATAALQATPRADRPAAFANAWTRREAALKSHGQQLSEWHADLSGASIRLTLPDNTLAAHLHLPAKPG